MSENLMRVEMSYGYDCKRVVDVTRYAADLTAEGKAYRDPLKRNRMSEIGLGEIWVSYDDNGLTPTFKANVIVRDTGEYSELYGIMARMASSLRRIMETSAKEFAARVAGVGITEEDAKAAIDEAVASRMATGYIRVDLHSLSGRVMKRAFENGCMLCGQRGVQTDMWKSFFDGRVTEAIVAGILRESPAVKCVGDYAEFQSVQAEENIEAMISLKLASDGVSRLLDDLAKDKK